MATMASGGLTGAALPPDGLALALSGGGARAAYQVGVLRGIATKLPHTRFSIITGVSAGAINAAFLASRPGPLRDAVDERRRACRCSRVIVSRSSWRPVTGSRLPRPI